AQVVEKRICPQEHKELHVPLAENGAGHGIYLRTGGGRDQPVGHGQRAEREQGPGDAMGNRGDDGKRKAIDLKMRRKRSTLIIHLLIAPLLIENTTTPTL